MKQLYWKARELDPRRLLWAWRRLVLLARIKLTALWFHASVEVDLAPDLRVGRQVRVEITPDTRNVLRIGRRSQLLDRVHIFLRGGEILVGDDTQIRKDCTLNVAGRFEMGDGVGISYGCFIHCAESVVLEPLVGLAELVTIADSTHYYTDPDVWFYENVRTAPVRVGYNTWLCPRVSVASGVTIGSHVIVAANSLVTKDVPDGHVASGVPVDSVRKLHQSWRRKLQAAT